MLFWQRNTRIYIAHLPAHFPRAEASNLDASDPSSSHSTPPRKPDRHATAEPRPLGAMSGRSTRDLPLRRMSANVALLSCALVVACVAEGASARALTSFTVETADLKIKAPASLAKTYDMAIANFGEPMYGATLRCARRHPPIRSPRSRLTRSRSGDPVHSPRLTHRPTSHRSGGLSYPTTIDASYRNGCQHFVSTPSAHRTRCPTRDEESPQLFFTRQNQSQQLIRRVMTSQSQR